MNSKLLNIFGIVAPIWLLLGVAIAGALYPGYSHVDQAMSELHAMGSPVAALSPLINNYPLGILFIGFGLFVWSCFRGLSARLSAAMVILHGLGSLAAGYFPCDAGCNPDSTSFNQIMHNSAGMVMALSLIIAPALWGHLGKRELQSSWFGKLSIACVVLQLITMPLLALALESGSGFGLYQRLGYGLPMVWMFVFAVLLLRQRSRQTLEAIA